MVLRAFKYMFEFRGRKYEHRRYGELVVEIVRVIKILSPLHRDAHRPDKWADAKGAVNRGKDTCSAHMQNGRGRPNPPISATPPESMHTPHMAAEGSLARRSIGKIKNSVQTT